MKYRIIDAFDFKWVTKQKWNDWRNNDVDGMYHKDFLSMYYDQDAVKVLSNGELNLITHYNPQIIDGYNIPFGVGLVSSLDNFRFGTFSIEIQLPKTPYVWPAFWAMSPVSWPPEIDIMEAWSGNNGKYSKWPLWLPFVKRNVTTNFHYNNTSTGTQPQRIMNPTNRFVKYELFWAPDIIQIRFDEKLVHEISDKNILKYFDVDMWVIINNCISNGYKGEISVMKCRNFKYVP